MDINLRACFKSGDFTLRFIFVGFLITSTAQAMDLVEFVSVGISSPTLQNQAAPSSGSRPGFTLGGGLSLSYPISETLALDAAVLYLSKNFYSIGGFTPEVKYGIAMLQYPLLIKYRLSRQISVGLGGYYSAGVGSLTRTQNSQVSTVSYSQAGFNSRELGLTSNIQFSLPVLENILWVNQLRFTYGFTDLAQSDSMSFKSRDLLLWSGIGFSL